MMLFLLQEKVLMKFLHLKLQASSVCLSLHRQPHVSIFVLQLRLRKWVWFSFIKSPPACYLGGSEAYWLLFSLTPDLCHVGLFSLQNTTLSPFSFPLQSAALSDAAHLSPLMHEDGECGRRKRHLHKTKKKITEVWESPFWVGFLVGCWFCVRSKSRKSVKASLSSFSQSAKFTVIF